MSLRIEELYAYIAVGDDGDEGVAGFMAPGTGVFMPLVGADIARKESLRGIAQQIATATGTTLRLVRFVGRVELEEIKPEAKEKR